VKVASIGYVSCRGHGRHAFGDRIDLNCAACVRVPPRKSDRQYVEALRKVFDLGPLPEPVAVGEQLATL
jgi:hypothetical protein